MKKRNLSSISKYQKCSFSESKIVFQVSFHLFVKKWENVLNFVWMVLTEIKSVKIFFPISTICTWLILQSIFFCLNVMFCCYAESFFRFIQVVFSFPVELSIIYTGEKSFATNQFL